MSGKGELRLRSTEHARRGSREGELASQRGIATSEPSNGGCRGVELVLDSLLLGNGTNSGTQSQLRPSARPSPQAVSFRVSDNSQGLATGLWGTSQSFRASSVAQTEAHLATLVILQALHNPHVVGHN